MHFNLNIVQTITPVIHLFLFLNSSRAADSGKYTPPASSQEDLQSESEQGHLYFLAPIKNV